MHGLFRRPGKHLEHGLRLQPADPRQLLGRVVHDPLADRGGAVAKPEHEPLFDGRQLVLGGTCQNFRADLELAQVRLKLPHKLRIPCFSVEHWRTPRLDQYDVSFRVPIRGDAVVVRPDADRVRAILAAAQGALLAVIAQQIYYRYFHGQTTNEMFALFGPGVQILDRRIAELLETDAR